MLVVFLKRLVGIDDEVRTVQERFAKSLTDVDESHAAIERAKSRVESVLETIASKQNKIRTSLPSGVSGGHGLNLPIGAPAHVRTQRDSRPR